MTNRGQLAQLVAQANPVGNPRDIDESLDLHAVLLAVIDDRSEDMAPEQERVIDRPRRVAKPIVAFGAALVVVLVAIGMTALLLAGPTSTVEPGDTAPDTVPPEPSTVTTIVDTETQTEAAIRTPDPSITWNTLNPGGSLYDGGAWAFGVGDGRVVVSGSRWSDGHGVWYSDDMATWTMATVEQTPPTDSTDPVGIGVLAHGSQGWVAAGSNQGGTDGTFWYSEDGTEWLLGKLNTPPASTSGWVVNSITPGGPGWVAVGGLQRDGRIWVSDDGRSWDTIALPEFAEVTFYDVLEDDGTLTVIGRPQGRQRDTVAAPADGVVALRWISQDGLTWTPLPFQAEPVGPETHTISVNPETGQQAALNQYGVWVSDDGSEWTEVASSSGIPPYTHPSQEVVWIGDTMIGGTKWYIYESSDGGATWARTGPTDLEFGHPRRLFTIGDNVIALALTDIWIGTLE